MSSRDIKNVDLNLLVVLDVLLEERNVSRAARRLALTQSTVSGMLSRLRDALGDPLFVRARHGIRPTPRAEAMTGPLRRWLDDARALVAPAEFEPAHWRGAVRDLEHGLHAGGPALPFAPRARRGGARAARRAGAARDRRARREARDGGARSGRHDPGVRASGPPVAPPLSRRVRRRDAQRASPRPAPASSRSTTSAASSTCSCRPRAAPSPAPRMRRSARLGRERRVRTSVPTFLLVPAMLEAEDLLAVLPRHLVAGRTRRLRLRPPPFEIPGFDVVAVWHPRVHDDPAHRWLRGRLAQTARRLG